MFDNSKLEGLNYPRHPLNWLESFLMSSGFKDDNTFIHFSRYTHTPKQMFDQREFLSFPSSRLSKEFLIEQLEMLRSDQELALHSKVNTSKGIYHIPMADLGVKDFTQYDRGVLKKFMDFVGYDFNIYDSGRSFHMYGNKMIEPWQWHQFMGAILLLNEPSGKRIIDARWVGHRLIAGYGALRLSLNTNQYKSYPSFKDILSNLSR